MSMKKIVLWAIVAIVVAVSAYAMSKSPDVDTSQDQIVFDQTLRVSREYVALRYRTDNILVHAKDFPSYAIWDDELSDIIRDWQKLDEDSASLGALATKMSGEKLSFTVFSKAYAYDRQEISDIFDRAPAGKKIATLAQHLGVDAKRAYKILQQDQDQVTADAWNEAGDTFQKLETSATVIKDGCKVAGFVGGIIATGGTSALAAGTTLAKTVVIVGGADLTLEVTEDAARIGLGNHNKISAIVGDVRKVTEPISTLLTISELPTNLTKGIDKLSVALVAVDQFNSAAQDGKVVGVTLPVYTKDKTKPAIKVAVLEKSEVGKWLSDNKTSLEVGSQEELENLLGVTSRTIPIATLSPLSETPLPTTTDANLVNTDDGTSAVFLASPVGKSFTPEKDLFFNAEMRNPESFLVKGKNLMVWCHWKFYMDNTLFSEKINPSTMTADTVNICGYSTLLVKQKGTLRVEFVLERGTKSKYSDEPSIQILASTKRSYSVLMK